MVVRRLALVCAAVLVSVGLVSVVQPAASGQAAPLVVTAAGDFAANGNTAGVLQAMTTTGASAAFALGDLSYGVTGQEQQWCDLVTGALGAGYPFELLAGNHESNGQNGNINDFSACLPNQLPGLVGTYGRQWYVDVPRSAPLVRFVMISPGIPFPDGTWSYAAGTPRYQWTAAAIDGARAAGVPWVVVGMHKPCTSIGQYACEPGADIVDLVLQKDVDLVLNGHEHLYQRTKQLGLSAGCPALPVGSYQPACVADADSDLVKDAGTVFATVGTGGVALRDVNTADPEAGYFAAWSGLNANPTHGALRLAFTGDELAASFVRGAGGTFADAFTIRRGAGPPPNTPPTAVIAAPTCSALACTFDGRGSTDTDGTITGHAWSFGDGTTGSGPTPAHTYTAGGTFPVTLTVTDDDGATASATRTVAVTGPGPAALAADDFERTVAAGWGTSVTGGAWTLSSTTNSSVAAGTGRLVLRSPGTLVIGGLNGVSAPAADVTAAFVLDRPATGSGAYIGLVGRRTPSGDYRAKVRLLSTGAVGLSLVRSTAAGVETTIATLAEVPGLRIGAGESFEARTQVTGSGPSTVRARVWRTGTAEPAGWQVTTTDSTAGLGAPGGVGVLGYLSSSATNAPITVAVDRFRATPPA